MAGRGLDPTVNGSYKTSVRSGSSRPTREVEHGIQAEMLTVPVPPAVLTLVARVELDFRPVGEGEFDLNNAVGAAFGTLEARL